jgi:hypothetical protein
VFSDKIKVHAAPLYHGGHVFVIDNALADPDALIQFAVRARAAFGRSALAAQPGHELHLTDSINSKFDNFFRVHLRQFYDARRTLGCNTRLTMTTLKPRELQPTQWLPQRYDQSVAEGESIVACALYLFRDESLGGIGFYEPQRSEPETTQLIHDCNALNNVDIERKYRLARGYCTTSNEYFKLVRIVPAKFNRLVFYDGAAFHASHIVTGENLSDSPLTARLTLNGFFHCKRNAGRFANRWTS